MNASLFSLAAGEHLFSSEVESFLEANPLGDPNWKWITLIVSLFVLLFLRKVVLWCIAKIKTSQRFFPKNMFMHFFLEQEIEKGLSWIIISGGALIVLNSLAFTTSIDKYAVLFVEFFFAINIIRICYFAAEAFGNALKEWAKTTDTDLDQHLAPFASKFLKVLVVVVGSLIMLQNFGVNVTALLAGLGIGGVALAFAAQDTVANVFGTITILLDRPFKLGDLIKIGDTEGTIDELGFRSTRVRTFYNSIITIPNSVVAKERIDNLTERRGWIRFRHTLGFTYNSTPAQLQAFSKQFKEALLKDKSVDINRVVVNFNSFGDYALNVLVNFHYHLEPGEVDLERVNKYLNIVFELATKNNLVFAFPTQTHIIQQSGSQITIAQNADQPVTTNDLPTKA
jgi:MscS family membrane protein